MQYLILFLEGMITFITPCMLPLVPLYLSFFAGGQQVEKPSLRFTLINAFIFILGFTIVFVSLGVFSASIGLILQQQRTLLNIIAGGIVVLLGLNYIFDFFKFSFLKGVQSKQKMKQTPFGSFIFGLLFAFSWSPCIGVFLGTALIQAGQSATALNGALLLFSFSLGLGFPLLISAIILNQLTVSFNWVKKNYRFVNICSGIFLVLIGFLMMSGWLDRIVVTLM